MSPGDIDAILRRLDTQDLVLSEVRADGKETKALAKLTNGRVTTLETQRRVDEALRAQENAGHDRTRQLLVALAGAAAGSLGMFVAYLLLEAVK